MISSAIIAAVWGGIISTLMQFWGWIAAGCIAVLAFLFSPQLRKYTIGVVAAGILLVMAFIYGYNSNDTVRVITHDCSDFAKLMAGEVTKVVNTFKRNGLCV